MSFSQRKEPPGRSASARCARAWLPRHEALGAEGLGGSAACCLRLSGYWGLAEAGRELPPAGHAASGFSWSIASRGLSEQRRRVSGSRDDPSAWRSGPGWHPLSLPGPCFVSSSAPAHFIPLLPSPAKVAALGRPRPHGDPVQVPSPCLVSHSEAGAVPVGRTPHAASGCCSTAPRLRAHEVARASDSHSLLLPRGGTTDFMGKGDWKSLEGAWRGRPRHTRGTCWRLPRGPDHSQHDFRDSGQNLHTQPASGRGPPRSPGQGGRCQRFSREGPHCTGKPLHVITMDPCPHSQSPQDLDGRVALDTELPRPLQNQLAAQTQGRAEGAARPLLAGDSPAPSRRPPFAHLHPVGSSRARPLGHSGPRSEVH